MYTENGFNDNRITGNSILTTLCNNQSIVKYLGKDSAYFSYCNYILYDKLAANTDLLD